MAGVAVEDGQKEHGNSSTAAASSTDSGPLSDHGLHRERQLRIRSQWRWRWHLQRLDSREHRIDAAKSTLSRNSATYGGGIINVGSLSVCKLQPEREVGLERWRHLQRRHARSHHRFLGTLSADGQRGEPRRRIVPDSGMATSNGFDLAGADCAFSPVGDRTVADAAHADTSSRVRSACHGGSAAFTMALLSTEPGEGCESPAGCADDGRRRRRSALRSGRATNGACRGPRERPATSGKTVRDAWPVAALRLSAPAGRRSHPGDRDQRARPVKGASPPRLVFATPSDGVVTRPVRRFDLIGVDA